MSFAWLKIIKFLSRTRVDKDGWVKGAIKVYNDGGTETATFVYNHNTGQAIY